MSDVNTDEKTKKIPVETGIESSYSPASLAGCIDHTLLKPEATPDDIRRLCDEARRHRFASVCVCTVYAGLAKRELEGSGVAVCCTVGFPLGAMSAEAKAEEARLAVRDGATEIDTVIHVGALKAGDTESVRKDIEAVVNATRDRALVKVIIEACLLSDEEKVKACEAAEAAGARFVKTSTGFSTGGATPEDVRLMRRSVGPGIGVKASGGIRSYEDAVNMIRAGANRLGTSGGVGIVSTVVPPGA